jgi:hypothetical protein
MYKKILFCVILIISIYAIATSFLIKNGVCSYIEIVIEQTNFLGLTKYKYTVNSQEIKIDSVTSNGELVNVYKRRIKEAEFEIIQEFVPNLLRLDTLYEKFAIDGTYNEIFIYKDKVRIKHIIIDNYDLEEKSILYKRINMLIDMKFRNRRLLLL